MSRGRRACALDDAGHGIQTIEPAEPGRNDAGREDHRGEVHQRLYGQGQTMGHVAVLDGQRGRPESPSPSAARAIRTHTTGSRRMAVPGQTDSKPGPEPATRSSPPGRQAGRRGPTTGGAGGGIDLAQHVAVLQEMRATTSVRWKRTPRALARTRRTGRKARHRYGLCDGDQAGQTEVWNDQSCTTTQPIPRTD